ncbi:MAG: 1-acyl-sn-glycerol-3-phosphate acyltransferase [Clostridiales bacterium]|nr:1-acyl-sn-glycerol-3-phosphate acyltransferase [Clostridiales bacterium]
MGEGKKKSVEYGCVPSTFWYKIFGSGIAITVCRFLFGMKIRADKKIRALPGPIVIAGNHPSYIDPIIMATTLYGRPINFVAGEFLFRRPIFGRVITRGGCIPKAQYRNDIRTVKAMMRVLSRGGVLGIFPEGTRLTDGHSIDFDKGLSTLVKKAGASLVIFRSHGAYMTWPRWSENSWRKGRITAEFTDVLPKEKVEQMSVDEIYDYMKKALVYDEYAYFADHPTVFRSKNLAAGVQNIANICPKCEGINVTRAGKNSLVCSACGNKVIMNKYGFFEAAGPKDKCFSNLHEWTEWEQTIYEREAAKPDYCLTEKVELHVLCGERDYAKVGEGVLTIRDGVVNYEGTECAPEEGIVYRKGKPIRAHHTRDLSAVAKPVKKEFPINSMKGILMDFGMYMELFEGNGRGNRFVPENPQRLFEIQSIVKAMKKQS